MEIYNTVLIDYIKAHRNKGYSFVQIKNHLIQHSYSPEDIDMAINQVINETSKKVDSTPTLLNKAKPFGETIPNPALKKVSSFAFWKYLRTYEKVLYVLGGLYGVVVAVLAIYLTIYYAVTYGEPPNFGCCGNLVIVTILAVGVGL